MLWLPEQTPPQITEDARRSTAHLVLEDGIHAAYVSALERLQAEHEALGEYLDRLGFALNDISAEGLWPERALKAGAALTLLAYRESGYYQTITEDDFNAGSVLASTIGIPDAYIASAFADQNLLALSDDLLPALPTDHDAGGYHQVYAIGAGCTRHYIQQTLAA